MQILVCENQPAIRKLIRRVAPPGYTVLEADSGDTCLELLTTRSADVLVLDLTLPSVSGLKILEERRRDAALTSIPAIVISGRHEPELREAALAAGADGFVTKPFSPLELMTLLEAVVLRQAGGELTAEERRNVENELLYRRANEAIERAAASSPPLGTPAELLLYFHCECAQRCETEIRLTRAEYEHVRSDPAWFALAPGHEDAALEAVAERHERYLVVAKTRAEGIDLAVADDPRA